MPVISGFVMVTTLATLSTSVFPFISTTPTASVPLFGVSDIDAPAQLLEVFPIIHLGLINKEAGPILVTFARPARIARRSDPVVDLLAAIASGDAKSAPVTITQRSKEDFSNFIID